MSRKYKNYFKSFVYDFYWILNFIIISISLICFTKETQVTVIGLALGFFYFIHQQKLQEAQFFQRLFTDFNQRYDELAEELDIAINEPKLIEANKVINRYLNLCAEEYLMYQRGYIPNEVWDTWRMGMRKYLNNQNVKSVWLGMKYSGGKSHYDFEIEDI